MQKKTVSKSYKIGDLVRYTPYYDDDIGPWQMVGDLGVVVSVREVEHKYQVVKVLWFSDNSEIDMAPDCLTKIDISNDKDLTKD
jgi:hypothetical protein